MDVVELLWVFVALVFVVLIVVFLMWFGIPENKAYLLRKLKKRNYVVATIRHGGGQLKEHVICAEAKKGKDDQTPTFSIGGREYIPIEKVTRTETVVGEDGKETERVITDSIVNFKSSVPVYFYNYDDSKPVALSGVNVEEKFRNPELMNSLFMQAQALYRTKAAKEIAALMKVVQTWDLRIWLILGACGGAFILGVINFMQLQSIQPTIVQVGAVLNQSFTQAVQNQFPG